jgi:hypothetical protein
MHTGKRLSALLDHEPIVVVWVEQIPSEMGKS